MALKVTDRLLHPPRVSDDHVARLFTRIDRPSADDRIFIDRLRHWCEVAGVDDANAISQSLWETDNLRSVRYVLDMNPVGLGITGDDTIQPFDIKTYDEAARVTVQAIYAMVKKQWHPGVPMPDGAVSWMNGVWLPKVRDPRYPEGVDQIRDQNRIYSGNRAVWAVDPGYLSHVDRFNQMVPGVPDQTQEQPPMSITFGKVPHPPYQDRPISKPEGRGQNNLGKRSVKGVVWHRILGSLWGTDGYFRNASVNALTDFGVGVLATDGAQNDGVILKWNDPYGFQSGWASGTYNGAYGDGLKFAQKYGVNAINRDQVSIEISGQYATPLSEKARDAIAGLTAYYADQYRIPWDQFPIAPQDGFSFVRWHQEFTLGTGKVCPGEVVIRETPALIERTRAILKRYQTADAPTPDPEPEPEPEPTPEPPKEHTLPDGMSRELAARLFGSYRAPWDGTVFTFDLRSAPSQVWLARAKRSIPDGKSWAHGDWPELRTVIRRGNGNQVWVWSDGFTYERKLNG